MDLHAWITQQVERVEQLIGENEWPPSQAEGVRLRCEAERRILARHEPQPNGTGFDDGWQCRTCSVDGGDGYQYLVPYPCPTVEDLAHAHGITADALAGLDHPRASEQADGLPADAAYELRITGHLTPPITTSDVPEALRGPRWKP
jgi:hypothetical protein